MGPSARASRCHYLTANGQFKCHFTDDAFGAVCNVYDVLRRSVVSWANRYNDIVKATVYRKIRTEKRTCVSVFMSCMFLFLVIVFFLNCSVSYDILWFRADVKKIKLSKWYAVKSLSYNAKTTAMICPWVKSKVFGL